jgi:spore coat protein I
MKIIDVYSKYEDLSKVELDIMYSILQFPQKFWRVVNKYYNSRRSWSEKIYVAKMREVVDEIPHHRKFLEDYDRLIFQK